MFKEKPNDSSAHNELKTQEANVELLPDKLITVVRVDSHGAYCRDESGVQWFYERGTRTWRRTTADDFDPHWVQPAMRPDLLSGTKAFESAADVVDYTEFLHYESDLKMLEETLEECRSKEEKTENTYWLIDHLPEMIERYKRMTEIYSLIPKSTEEEKIALRKEAFELYKKDNERSEFVPRNFYDCTYFVIRHAAAEYQLNKRVGKSESPESPINAQDQDFISDLSEAGKEAALTKAKEFLKHFNKNKDVLYIAASDLVRARETAYIYTEAAKELGFTVLETRSPETEEISKHQAGKEIYESLGKSDIRSLDSLSLHIDNALVDWIFTPEDLLNTGKENTLVAHPENISESTKALWKEARAIIEADNKGSWGKNWLAHGKAVQDLFKTYQEAHPQEKVAAIASAEDMYEKSFSNIVRIMSLAKNKISGYEAGLGPEQRLRVLAFTHENPFIYFLNTEYGREGIDTLETIGFDVMNDDKGKHVYASLEEKSEEVKEIKIP